MKYYINIKTGLLYLLAKQYEDFIECDGRYLSIHEYPDLYKVIGDNYCKKYIKEKKSLSFIRKILGLDVFSLKENPLYRNLYFKIPDLRISVKDLMK